MSWRSIPVSQIICLLNTVLSGMQSGHLGILALVLKTQTGYSNLCSMGTHWREDWVDRHLAHSTVKRSCIFWINLAS